MTRNEPHNSPSPQPSPARGEGAGRALAVGAALIVVSLLLACSPLLLGKGDTGTGGILRDNAQTRAQGGNRHERGKFYFARSEAAARSLGARFAWRLREVTGAGHENEDMAPAAAMILGTGELPPGF